MNKRKKRSRMTIIILSIAGMLAGLSLLVIPFVTDRSNANRNRQAISSMTSAYDRYADNAQILSEQLEQAAAYNACLAGSRSQDGICNYEEQLSFDGEGVMGYLCIPSIDLKILIYHGTDEETLAMGAGHLEETSLPVGGISSHCVLTAHSGLSSMRAFDDLRKLKQGDLFAACIYGHQYVYAVESIEVVLPEETNSLEIIPGEDRMTLVTCTPYGINDHRLLVHGIRTDQKLPEAETADAEEEEKLPISEQGFALNLRTIPLLAAGLIVIAAVIFILINWNYGRRKKRK